MSDRLRGKTAIVTGGARGIGLGIARELVSHGAKAVCVSRTAADVETAVYELQSLGEASGRPCDVSSVAAVDDLVRYVRSEYGAIDILVCSHGVAESKPFLELTDDQWERTLRINLTGAFLCGRAVATVMVKDGTPGRIVNITSTDSMFPERGLSDYAASKAGLKALTQAMAYDLADYGITVNAVAPGWIRTPMSEPFLSEDILTGETKVTPVGRIGMPYDVAAAVTWLVDPDSSFVTGTTVVIDGGQTAVQWTPDNA